ncbi:hypothetical protein QPX96_04710 [Limosilactobacillus fermentum]|nr:hypothetical protein [Limosilactobacillus fermentum]
MMDARLTCLPTLTCFKNHLQAPQSVRFAHRLKQAGVEVGAPLSLNQLADRLATQLGGADNDE